MKVLVIENSLDDLLNVKISVNGGQSYTDYSVSSLKNGITFDCSPSDLKVICDTNILNYIKVFADGEKLNAGSGGGDFVGAYKKYVGRGYCCWVCSSKDIAEASFTEDGQDSNIPIPVVDSHCISVSGSIDVEKFNITFTDGQTAELDTITDVSY